MDERESNLISMARIELILDPDEGDLWTGPAPVVRGTHFPPLQEVGVQVSCQDAKGRLWKSSNAYLVSADGIFDTSLTSAVGEGYYGIAPEGPFYSMACVDGPRHDFSTQGIERLDFSLACFDGSQEIWSAKVTRHLGRELSAEIPTPRVRVLLFDDRAGSHEPDVARMLAAYGVVVVTRADETGGGLVDLDLPSRPDLPTFIVGSGRASARALETAICLPDTQAVILFSGGGLRFDPIVVGGHYDEAGDLLKSSLGYIKLDHSALQPKADGVLVTRKVYAEAVADRSNRDQGRIEVEKIACPLYMFSGLDDQIWPSSAFSELAAQRRKMKGCSFPTYHRTFEGVGHDIGPSLGLPSFPTTERSISYPDIGFRLLLGGKGGRQARARRECWDSLLSILSGKPPQA